MGASGARAPRGGRGVSCVQRGSVALLSNRSFCGDDGKEKYVKAEEAPGI